MYYQYVISWHPVCKCATVLNLSHEIRVTSIQALLCVTSTKQRKNKHD